MTGAAPVPEGLCPVRLDEDERVAGITAVAAFLEWQRAHGFVVPEGAETLLEKLRAAMPEEESDGAD